MPLTLAHTPPDYYIRLTKIELLKIQLIHLRTEYPLTSDSHFDGYSEWTTTINDTTCSVACYWHSRENNVISADPIDILTNLMMLDDKGYDAGTIRTGEVLLDVLRTRWLNLKYQPKHVPLQPVGSDGRLQ